MKNTFFGVAAVFVVSVAIFSCSENNSSQQEESVTKRQVIETYADIAFANYKKAYDDAVVLEAAITTFTTTPTQANFDNAKAKWKLARESYGTTEAFRFADGPIDNADGPEGLMNAWPLDEVYVDYVSGGAPNAGIINDLGAFPTINKSVLEGLNEQGGEKNISVGYHAIEFLLWGQDLTDPSASQPGLRPYTDYLTTGGTASNQARRAAYLKACADLLTDNLDYLVNEWKVGGTYRNTFFALSDNVALKNIYLGIVTLITAELPEERMNTALQNANQEDEHSCFSDNTHRDIALNLQGVINIYQGHYSTVDGPSLQDLIRQADTTVYNDTETSLNASSTKVAAIMIPFDWAISGGPTSVEGMKVSAARLQLINFGANLLAGATKIGIVVN
ncbi:imelysin family protein [Flavobacterium sp.]|uniref:imelysin family protein n=1 Tax=Flavobacterium sp. TaxID=239 RepID=UPI003D6C0AD7